MGDDRSEGISPVFCANSVAILALRALAGRMGRFTLFPGFLRPKVTRIE